MPYDTAAISALMLSMNSTLASEAPSAAFERSSPPTKVAAENARSLASSEQDLLCVVQSIVNDVALRASETASRPSLMRRHWGHNGLMMASRVYAPVVSFAAIRATLLTPRMKRPKENVPFKSRQLTGSW